MRLVWKREKVSQIASAMDKINSDTRGLEWLETKKFAELIRTSGYRAQIKTACWVIDNVPEEEQKTVLAELLECLGLVDIVDEDWIYAPMGKFKHRFNEDTRGLEKEQTLCKQIVKKTWNSGGGASRQRCTRCAKEHARLLREPGTPLPLKATRMVIPRDPANAL